MIFVILELNKILDNYHIMKKLIYYFLKIVCKHFCAVYVSEISRLSNIKTFNYKPSASVIKVLSIVDAFSKFLIRVIIDTKK